MSAKRVFFGVLQKIMVICSAIFFGFSNAFSANLPAGYTELEYIKSTGTQVIDSGTLIKRTSKIVLDAEITYVVTANAILAGNASSSWTTQAVVRFEKNNVLRISANTSGTASTYDTERHTYTLDINNGTGSKDGVVFNTFSNTGFSSTDNWQIFGVWWNNKYDFMTPAKLYSVKIYDGDTLVRNLVPAKNSSGVIGMYDTVNNVFYQNAGTGKFTPGPVVGIRIATTAYNAARFNPVKTDLNNAVATIREIVTKTINQTAAIASLQADKQTRPEDACPAGKKCLLVETEENGVIVPHWFPIIEAPEE